MLSFLGSQEKPLGDDSYVSSNEGDAPINLEQGKLKIELKSKEDFNEAEVYLFSATDDQNTRSDGINPVWWWYLNIARTFFDENPL